MLRSLYCLFFDSFFPFGQPPSLAPFPCSKGGSVFRGPPPRSRSDSKFWSLPAYPNPTATNSVICPWTENVIPIRCLMKTQKYPTFPWSFYSHIHFSEFFYPTYSPEMKTHHHIIVYKNLCSLLALLCGSSSSKKSFSLWFFVHK